MGLQIGEIVRKKEIAFSDLRGKVIAVDAFNALYQFLSSIRQPDGTPLMDSAGRITSHLSGLFYRNIFLLSEGIKLIYVFDGEYDELKGKTREKRGAVREAMKEKYEKAKEEEDIENMGKYAKGFSRIDEVMIEESKELLGAMGIAVVQAPSEGEMQCAEFVKMGEAYAVASQDYDALVVGGERLIQNLTLARRRKTISGYIDVRPQMIECSNLLNELEIDADRFICLAILVGTDFNPGGIKGLGPKKALNLVRAKKYPVEIFREVEGRMDFDWKKVFEIFKKPKVKQERVKFPKLDFNKIKEILVGKHDFSEERVEKQLGKLRSGIGKASQQTLF